MDAPPAPARWSSSRRDAAGRAAPDGCAMAGVEGAGKGALGGSARSALTSSSFSRMSFSVSTSATGGITGMGKSVPLSRVSLLWAERGGEGVRVLPQPPGTSPHGCPNPRRCPAAPPAQPPGPVATTRVAFSRQEGCEGLQAPPKPQHPQPRGDPGTSSTPPRSGEGPTGVGLSWASIFPAALKHQNLGTSPLSPGLGMGSPGTPLPCQPRGCSTPFS